MPSTHGALIKPSYLQEYFVYFKILEGINFVIMVTSLLLYYYMFRSQRVCHPNLATLMLYQPATLTVSTSIRVLRHCLGALIPISPIAYQIFSFSAEALTGCSLQATFGYAIERGISLKYLENYEEKFRTNKLGLIIVFCTTFYVVFEVFIFYSDFTNGWTIFLAIYLMYLITIMFFIGMYLLCKKIFVRVYRKRYATVEDRYRTQDNYKSSRLMVFLASYKCATSIAIIAFYQFAVDMVDDYYQTFTTFIFFYLLQYQIVIQMFLTIFAERNLRVQFLGLIKRRPTISPESTVRNAYGERIVFSGAESKDIYFNQLKFMWK